MMLSLGMGAVLFAYTGMLTLCQGLERHFKPVWGRPAANWLRRSLRVAGWGALTLSFGLCVAAWGWAIGPVTWFGVLSLTGFCLVMVLPYRPRLAIFLAGAAPAWGLAWLLP